MSTRASVRDAPVLLVSMPFGPVFWPSYALSLLKAELRERGLSAEIFYGTIPFAERIGQALYSDIAGGEKPTTCELAGEWIFSSALFGPRDPEPYVDEILRRRSLVTGKEWVPELSPAFIERVVSARGKTEEFLDWCLERVLERRPRIVGFTSSFQQHVASLALAERIKRAAPDSFIVLGGANCEGVMGAETLCQFSFVDAVVSGEGDVVFPELVSRVLASEPVSRLPGVRLRGSAGLGNAPMVENLDELPFPDFEDYFAQFAKSRFHGEWQPSLFFETSRGCWWGERQHCTFCGLNGNGMAYRSKSGARALRELEWLAEKYPDCDLDVVDNILDLKYFDDFLPRLADRRLNVSLFYETKANLKKEQVRALARSGVGTIQPGIESLSDPVLALMRKGVSALQNVQLLKWCKELSVQPSWNFLWGFPGEPAEEYARMSELVPSLVHLPPPQGIAGLRLDRFSPHFFEAERRGIEILGPLDSYRHVYPLSEEALSNIAYFFSFSRGSSVSGEAPAYVRPLLRELRKWKSAARKSDLFSVDVSGRLLLWDLRPKSRDPLVVLEGVDRALYLACDEARDLATLARMAADAEDRIQALVERRLMISHRSRSLSLAIPLGDYAPSREVTERFLEIARASGYTRRRGVSNAPLRPEHFRLTPRGELLVRYP